MRKVLYLTILLVLVFAVIGIVGCRNICKGYETISGTGTIKFIYLEGGFYGIIGDNGDHYDPINLNQEFQVDGLRVRFEAKIRDDLASFHMWGTIIEIIKIEKLD